MDSTDADKLQTLHLNCSFEKVTLNCRILYILEIASNILYGINFTLKTNRTLVCVYFASFAICLIKKKKMRRKIAINDFIRANF